MFLLNYEHIHLIINKIVILVSTLSLSKNLTNHVLSMNSKFSFSVLHQYSTILFLRKRFHFSSSEWSKNFQMYDIIPILGLSYWYMNIECFYNDCVFIYRTFAIKCEHSYKILYCLQRTLVTKTWTSASFFNRLYLWHFKNNLFTLQHIKIVDQSMTPNQFNQCIQLTVKKCYKKLQFSW